MTMPNTPARPELPEPLATIQIGDKEVRQRWFTEKEVRALLADERRKALEEAAQSFEKFFSPSDELDVAYVCGSIRALDRKEPTT